MNSSPILEMDLPPITSSPTWRWQLGALKSMYFILPAWRVSILSENLSEAFSSYIFTLYTSGQIYVERPVKHWLGPGDQAMFDPESCCWVVVGRVRQELLKQQQLYGGRTRYIPHSSAQCNYWIHALDLTFWFGEHILKICISFYNNVELRSKKCNSCRSGSLQEQNDQ